MKQLRNISRYIAGFVFVFSGLVKGIDPMGSMYKFIDYFTAFNIDALQPLAYILGILLCTLEFIVGFAVITGIRMRPAAWGLLIFMAVFTPLTLFLAISDPVSDCGCFGDAIHLTNWQTFYKNIFISVFVIIVFLERKKYKSLTKPAYEWGMLALVTVIFLLFTQYNKNHLPVVDFRPYKTGTSIPESMTIPEGAPMDEYETKLIYEKNGRQEEFTLENYPSDDTSWVFVDSKTELIKKGYTPPIYDFMLTSGDGQDMTDILIHDEGYNFLMLSLKISEADKSLIDKGIEAGISCNANDIGFYVLTSSTPRQDTFPEDIEILFVDETIMKTIIRSDPGFMVLKDGIITAKWAGQDLPPVEDLPEVIYNSYPAGSDNGTKILMIILSGIFIIAISIEIILRNLNKKV